MSKGRAMPSLPASRKIPPSDGASPFPDHRIATLPDRILIIDDNPEAAQTLGWLMEEKGHNYKLVFDSTKAVEIAREYKPRYIFLDLGMPEINGYELCEQMRALPELANSVFIAQTGWSDKEFVERAKRAGFHHHLVKPIGSIEIEAVLR